MPHTATTLSSQLSQHHRAYKIQIAYSKKIICIIINILRARSQICSQLKLIYNHFGKIIKKKASPLSATFPYVYASTFPPIFTLLYDTCATRIQMLRPPSLSLFPISTPYNFSTVKYCDEVCLRVNVVCVI